MELTFENAHRIVREEKNQRLAVMRRAYKNRDHLIAKIFRKAHLLLAIRNV